VALAGIPRDSLDYSSLGARLVLAWCSVGARLVAWWLSSAPPGLRALRPPRRVPLPWTSQAWPPFKGQPLREQWGRGCCDRW